MITDFNKLLEKLKPMIARHWMLAISLFALQFVVYNIFFSSLVLTCHTMSSAMVQEYPSFRTQQEGRWLQDLIILILGSTGAHSFLMFVAAALQSFNAILLLSIADIRSKLFSVILGIIFCLYPSFLDYFGFAIDHVSFIVGDTLILIGCLAFIHLRSPWQRVVFPSIAYTCALAIYQPKLSLILCASIIGLLAVWVQHRPSGDSRLSYYWNDVGLAALGLAAAVALYLASAAVTVTMARPALTKFNSPMELWLVTKNAYVLFIEHFAGGMGGIPPWLSILPLILVLTGVLTLVVHLWRVSPTGGLLALTLLCSLPVALSIAGIINPDAPIRAGRGSSAFAFVFVFLIAWALKSVVPQKVALCAVGVVVYCFVLFAAQRNASAEFKHLWETNFISRITSRVETTIQMPVGNKKPLVVIGQFHYPHHARFVKYPSTHARSVAFIRAFAPYAQVRLLNFFIGREALRSPTSDEVNTALESATNRKVWPHAQSVYEHNGIVIIILETPAKAADTTMAAG
jgi:hypothetical protein